MLALVCRHVLVKQPQQARRVQGETPSTVIPCHQRARRSIKGHCTTSQVCTSLQQMCSLPGAHLPAQHLRVAGGHRQRVSHACLSVRACKLHLVVPARSSVSRVFWQRSSVCGSAGDGLLRLPGEAPVWFQDSMAAAASTGAPRAAVRALERAHCELSEVRNPGEQHLRLALQQHREHFCCKRSALTRNKRSCCSRATHVLIAVHAEALNGQRLPPPVILTTALSFSYFRHACTLLRGAHRCKHSPPVASVLPLLLHVRAGCPNRAPGLHHPWRAQALGLVRQGPTEKNSSVVLVVPAACESLVAGPCL